MSRILSGKIIRNMFNIFCLAVIITAALWLGSASDTGGFIARITGTTTTKAATPPTVNTVAASPITESTATLNGNLTSLGTATLVNVSFEYGTTTSYSFTITGVSPTLTSAGAFTANLTSLIPGQTYHFRAKAVGDGTVRGKDTTFTTNTQPEVITNSASNISTTSATLNGNLSGLGSASSVTVSFEYGKTTNYGSRAVGVALTLTTTGAFAANLTGLTSGQTYHFRAKAVGSKTAYGSDMAFTTESVIDTNAPAISEVKPLDITVSGSIITWTTNEAATSEVEYGLTAEYGSNTTVDTTLVNSHSVEITGLKAGTTYYYRIISKDFSNNQAVSANDSFTTNTGSGRMPIWFWVIIGLTVVVLIVSLVALFFGVRLVRQ